MTTDINELARRVERIISDVKLKHGGNDTYAPVMKWDEFLALVEALEKAQAENTAGVAGMAESYETTISMLRSRIAELEYRTVKLPKPHAHLIWIQAGHAPDDYWDDVVVSHSEKDRCCDGSERYPVYARWEIEEMLAAAGIKVEDE